MGSRLVLIREKQVTHADAQQEQRQRTHDTTARTHAHTVVCKHRNRSHTQTHNKNNTTHDTTRATDWDDLGEGSSKCTLRWRKVE